MKKEDNKIDKNNTNNKNINMNNNINQNTVMNNNKEIPLNNLNNNNLKNDYFNPSNFFLNQLIFSKFHLKKLINLFKTFSPNNNK